jgi:hypothetical protein
MRKCLILLFAFTTTSVSGAPAWTWVDANGQVHYSDRPVPGAKQVDLPGAQGFGSAPRSQTPAAAATGSTNRQADAAAAEKPGPVAQRYRAFNVVSPKQQETLWNVGGVVNVQVELDPPLQPNHKLDVYLDGELKNLNSTGTTLALDEVPRGIHSVQAVVLDQNGTEVVRSLATTFMVQQTSIQNPQNPQRPRPQPKN